MFYSVHEKSKWKIHASSHHLQNGERCNITLVSMKSDKRTLLSLVFLLLSSQTQAFLQPHASAVLPAVHDVVQARQNLSQNSVVVCPQMLLQFITQYLTTVSCKSNLFCISFIPSCSYCTQKKYTTYNISGTTFTFGEGSEVEHH